MLAPTLFNLFFDAVTRMALNSMPTHGVNIEYNTEASLVGNRRKLSSRRLLQDLLYADDMALMADTEVQLKELLVRLDGVCTHMGLSVSVKKTEILAVQPLPGATPPTPVQLRQTGEHREVKVVHHFEYLGSIVSDDCSLDKEVESRIAKASRAFGSLSRILWYQRKIKRHTKLRLFRAVILPSLLYGCESCAHLAHHVSRLQSFVMRCLRIILGVSLWKKLRNTAIRERAGMPRISTLAHGKEAALAGTRGILAWTWTASPDRSWWPDQPKPHEQQADRRNAGEMLWLVT